jgi:hypothetical protein
MLKTINGHAPTHSEYEDVHIFQRVGRKNLLIMYKNIPFGWLSISKDAITDYDNNIIDSILLVEFNKI